MTETDVYDALKEAYRRSGTQQVLAKKAGISQGRIADYLNKRYSVGNMTCTTLLRLFPEMRVDFFGEMPSKNISGSNIISNTGDINEPVNQVSGGMFGLKNFLDTRVGNKNISDAKSSSDMVPRRILERKIRKSNKFSPEERLKFLDFLDEEV